MGRNETEKIYGETIEEELVQHLRRCREAELKDESDYHKDLEQNPAARRRTKNYDDEWKNSVKFAREKRRTWEEVISSPELTKMMMHMLTFGQEFWAAMFFKIKALMSLNREARGVGPSTPS